MLMEARAFAANVVLPDGRIWILGGLGSHHISGSTEILEKSSTNGKWKITEGPNLHQPLFGHCAIVLPNGAVLVAGGFNGTGMFHKLCLVIFEIL